MAYYNLHLTRGHPGFPRSPSVRAEGGWVSTQTPPVGTALCGHGSPLGGTCVWGLGKETGELDLTHLHRQCRAGPWPVTGHHPSLVHEPWQ